MKMLENMEKEDLPEEEEEGSNEENGLEDYVIDLATDIVQFKVNSRVSIFS